MNEVKSTDKILPHIVDLIIRLAAVFVLGMWSYMILRPFILPVVWGGVLAVAVFPGFKLLEQYLGGRKKLAAVMTSFLLLLVIVVPSWLFADSLIEGIAVLKTYWDQGKLGIPEPQEQVKDWPIIGERIYDVWTLASQNLASVLEPLVPELKTLSTKLLGALAGAGFAVLQFVFSIVIAGILLAASDQVAGAFGLLFGRLASERGNEFVKDAETTVRNVARGIVGVAVIQSVLAGIGMSIAGIPGAGLWALVCLVLGIIQIGVGPVLIVACIYLFSTASSLAAILFAVWSIVVAALDNILKPFLLSQGAPVPMLVVFLGAIGGFLNSGIIGLFLGAVILSLAYKLFVTWLEPQVAEGVVSGGDTEGKADIAETI